MTPTPYPTPESVYKASDTEIPASEKEQFIVDLGGALASDLGVTNDDVVTAQSTANDAVSDAAAAQSTADDAVSDAAAAQSTADDAVIREARISDGLSGSGAVTLDYANVDSYTYTATGDVTITPSNVPTGQVVKLKIIKDASYSISFSGVGSTVDGQEIGRTTLVFEINNIDGTVIVTQVNCQEAGDFVLEDMGIIGGALATVDYCRFSLNNNFCHLQGEITFIASSVTDFVRIYITKRSLGDFYLGNQLIAASANVDYDSNSYDVIGCNIKDDRTNYYLYLKNTKNTFWNTGDVVVFRFSAFFEIK